MNNMFTAMLAAATAKVEVPVDGLTGVWIKSGATVISSGMKMTGATVSSGQSQTVYNRGAANSTTVVSGGSLLISSGGTANSPVAHGAAVRVNVSRGGSAFGAEIYSSARMNVMGSGALASGISVRGPDGFLNVYGQGASAASIVMSAGAYVYVYQNGVISGITQSAGNVYVSSAGTATAVTMIAGGVNVYANGSAENFTVNGGTLRIQDGGRASGITVAAGGTLVVSSGATALGVVSSGGTIDVISGGYIEYA